MMAVVANEGKIGEKGIFGDIELPTKASTNSH
jgi:hypothetical protein